LIIHHNSLFSAQAEDAKSLESKLKLDGLVADINRVSQDAANNGLIDKEKYIIPPHLHDLQEADLPETQRGLVISEIAQFRERAAKREREKMRDVRESIPSVMGAPSGPKAREWGKPQNRQTSPQASSKAFGKGPQGYNKPVGFVKADDGDAGRDSVSEERQLQPRTDEELEAEKKELRRQEEEISFKDVRVYISRTVV
jgi:RNA-binding protein 25